MSKVNEITKKWNDKCTKGLMGKTIAYVRYMTEKEKEDHGWYKSPLIIFFTDKSYIYSSSDDEGNDGGAMFTSIKGLETIPTI